MRKLSFTAKGLAPLLMHNSQGANPLNPLTKQLKAATSKKKKTDADLEHIAKCEFAVGMYQNERGPCLPANMIQANIIRGAMKSKEGKLAKVGVIAVKDADLIYEGPRTNEELFEQGFFFSCVAKNQKNSIVRTRPMFKEWSAKIELEYDPDVVNEEQVRRYVQDGGHHEGYGDWRPTHGRFEAVFEEGVA